MKKNEREIIWAFGGGVQTVSIAILIKLGKLPIPVYAGMADTSYERQAVWEYNQKYTFPMLAGLGLVVDIIPHSYSTIDIESNSGDLLLPVYTGAGGKLPTFCSDHWKQRAMNRRLRELGFGPKRPVKKWLGYSLDEYDRMKQTGLKWIINDFPLLLGYGIRYRRVELEKIISDFGWPKPPSSACDFCPNRDDQTWLEIKNNEPKTFQNAVDRDEWLRQPEQTKKWGDTYLHRAMIPLSDIDFKETESLPLFNLCGSGCWT